MSEIDMKKDPFEQITRVPVKVLNGQLVHLHEGTEITELREGAVGNLMVARAAITDKERLALYNSESIVEILEKGTRLRARIAKKKVP